MSMQQQSHPGASIAWRNAPTKDVDVGGTRFVYRELGPDTGVPVIFLNHLAAELDESLSVSSPRPSALRASTTRARVT